MTDDHCLVDMDIVGYQPIVFKARQNTKRRSVGVAFYVKDELPFQVVSFKTDIESLIIKITRESKTLYIICSIYRTKNIKINLHCLPSDVLVFSEGFAWKNIAFW